MSLFVDIQKTYGTFTLSVKFQQDGDVLGLLGASGCGKTLTLRAIAGIITPDSGCIVLNGKTLFDSEQRINIPPQKRRVGYLFQNYALFPNMNVRQNIACGVPRSMDKKTRDKVVSNMIDKMQLTEQQRHFPAHLSGGQQQRVALARILVGEPEILLLDEPFSALDSYLKGQMLLELHGILERFGKDAVLVTHNRSEAYQLCENLAIMDNGKICDIGDTKMLFSNPGTVTGAVLTGCKNIVAAERAGETQVYIPEWELTLETGRKVAEGLSAIGIRAHYFGRDIAENTFAVKVLQMIEEPFEWTVNFMYENQNADTKPVTWKIPKGGDMEFPPRLGVLPENIHLLYEWSE